MRVRLDVLLIRRQRTTRHKTAERNWNQPRQFEEKLSCVHAPVTPTENVLLWWGKMPPAVLSDRIHPCQKTARPVS
jgi:hypothetical protein